MQKIGIISDVHAYPVALKEALSLFEREKVAHILCAGDIAGYYDGLNDCIELLQQYQCKTIIGNHDQSYLEQCSDPIENTDFAFLNSLPETLEFKIEEKSLFMVHAQPPTAQHGGIKILDQQGEIIPSSFALWNEEFQDFDFDILVIGHTHQVFAEYLGGVLVINPGSVPFNHSCMILNLPSLKVETYALENKSIVRCWNFSHLFSSSQGYPKTNRP